MSLQANIDHLAIAAGIEAVVVESAARDYRGDQTWHAVLDGALDLFKRTNEKSIRLVVGTNTIVVQKEGEETVGVVLPTGHAIAKSLRRMIRRMSRKNRGPLPKQEAASPSPSPSPSAPVVSPPSAPVSSPPSPSSHTVAPASKPADEGTTSAPERSGFVSF